MFRMPWKGCKRSTPRAGEPLRSHFVLHFTNFSSIVQRLAWPLHVSAALGAIAFLGFGCSDDQKPDAIPPAAVNDLRASEVGRNALTLRWTAPGDDGTSGTADSHEIRRHDAEITLSGWDSTGTLAGRPSAAPAGSAESLRVEDLGENQLHYFALRTVDDAGNRSGISNVLTIRTASSDSIAPAGSTLALVRAASRQAVIAWIAPGDDSANGRAAAYELRLAEEVLTSENWDSTGMVVDESRPEPPGGIETRTLVDLLPQHRYYAALRTRDEAENWSAISNVLSFDTYADDTVPPGTVTDLTARLTAIDAVELSFTAPGDDGGIGTAFAYDLRYAADPDSLATGWERASVVPAEAPQRAGRREIVVVDSLPPLTRFYFGLRSSDEAGLRSELSNIAQIMTSDTTCVVRADSTGDYPTIGSALRDGAGCTIMLDDGIYRGRDNTRWPEASRPRLRSLSGNAEACIIDFEDGTGDLGTEPILEGLTLRNASELRLRAEEVPDVLRATGCVFEDVAFEAVGPFSFGPRVTLTDCLLRNGTRSPVFNVDRFFARGCHFEDNQTRLVIARELEIETSTFLRNGVTSGALLRTYHDLARGSFMRVTGSRFVDNGGTLLGPFDGELLVEETLFVRNSEIAIYLSNGTATTIRACTFVRNFGLAGSCVVAEALDDTLRIERSIFVDNRGGPLLAAVGDAIPLAVSCTDLYANEAGDWVRQFDGWLGRDGNISVDPIFCDFGNEDYTLRPHSPCAPDSQPDCGRIGALDVGCR